MQIFLSWMAQVMSLGYGLNFLKTPTKIINLTFNLLDCFLSAKVK